MPFSDIPTEYKPWCEEQAARTHETEWEYWHQHAPEDYRLFQTEYKRLKAAGQERVADDVGEPVEFAKADVAPAFGQAGGIAVIERRAADEGADLHGDSVRV